MINNFFKQLSASWKSKKRSQKAIFLAAFFLLFIGIGLFSSINPVSAQDAASTPSVSVPIPDIVINLFTRIMLMLTRFALELMLFILTFVIQVAGYNGFLESEAVNIGWVMVRDLTNMVFVVALLLIAFGTILGLENYEWKQMLFKLISAAVLVNFSRIIAGIIIDIAQVVMITFVNGIAATAGGNFIRAFSLDSIRSFSETSTSEINAEGVFLAALASLFISVTIMVTSGLLLAMLIGRVIILWILIVLSPIAFVLSVLPQTKSYADEWWGQFGKQVITGPVLVFFLWLTLVAVGNGVVKDHFANNTVVPESQIIKSSNAEQRLGIGKATSWDNLINFIVAIAMLIAGIRVTQQLGGFGAEWTSKAVDIGKKVALTASGAYAVRWGLGKGAELAKAGGNWAAMNVPVVGGKAWQRTGRRIGAWASNRYVTKGFLGMPSLEERLKKANERMDALKVNDQGEYNEKRWWKRFQAQAGTAIFSPEMMREKLTEDKEDLAKINTEIMTDHYMSTSSTKIGREKTAAKKRLEERARTGLQIKSEKEKDEEERREKIYEIIGRSGKVEDLTPAQISELGEHGVKGMDLMRAVDDAKRRDKGRGSHVRAEKGSEMLSEMEKQRVEEATKKYLHEPDLATLKPDEAKKALKTFKEAQNREAVIARARAEAQSIHRTLEKETEIDVAKAKDEILVRNGEKPRFLMATLAAHAKEVGDQLANLNFREITERTRIFAEELAKEAKASPGSKMHKQKSVQAMVALMTSMGRGSETGLQALHKAAQAKGINFGEEIKAENYRGMQRMILSVVSGRKVNEGEEEQVFDELKKLHGDTFNLLLRGLDDSLKKAGQEFAPNLTGLIDDTETDGNGNVIFKLQTNDGDAEKGRDYWAGTVNASKVITLGGMVTNKNGSITENPDLIDDRSKKNFVMVFRNITRGTKIDARLATEWHLLKPEVRNRLMKALEEARPDAAEILKDKLEGKTERKTERKKGREDEEEGEGGA